MSSIWTLRRSATDTKLAGLCGGVAEHWGVDPLLVRVGWVLLTLSGGVGAVLYVAGWWLVPVEGRSTSTADDVLGANARRWPREVWVALVAIACLAAFAVFGSVSPFGVGPAVVIACIWYFGFYKQRQGSSHTPPVETTAAGSAPGLPSFVAQVGPPTPFTVAADRWRQRIEEHAQQSSQAPSADGAPAASWPTAPATFDPSSVQDPAVAERTAFLATADPVGLYTPAPAATAMEVPVRRRDSLAARRLRLSTVLVLGLALSGLTLADRSGIDVGPATYAATALLVLGLALVAATWWGRARGLLPLALLLVPVVAITSAPGPFGPVDHWSDTTRTYAEVSALPATADLLGSGRVVVDLSGLRLTGDATYPAHLDAGRLDVVVPRDVDVELRYDVGFGAVEVFDQPPVSGLDLVGTLPPAAPVAGRPTLTLDLTVDGGKVEVRR